MLLVLLGAARAESADVSNFADGGTSLDNAITSGDTNINFTLTGEYDLNSALSVISIPKNFITDSGEVNLIWTGATDSYLLSTDLTNPTISLSPVFNLNAQGNGKVKAIFGEGSVIISGGLANTIFSKTQGSNDYAYGILANGYQEWVSTGPWQGYWDVDEGNISITGDLSGSITAESGDDHAYGLRAGGPAFLPVAGNITITGNVTEDAEITATAEDSDAYGFYAQGGSGNSAGDITITGSLNGDVTATAETGQNAYGFRAYNNISIGSVGGSADVIATAHTDNAYGFRAVNGYISNGVFVGGDITIGDFEGDVTARTMTGDNAYGMRADGDITAGDVGRGGSVWAFAGDDYAYGMRAGRTVTVGDVTKGGSIGAEANDHDAYGIVANRSVTIGDVSKGGSISAETETGTDAYAVRSSILGSITIGDVTQGGSISADAGQNNAYGVQTTAGDISIGEISCGGSISAEAGGNYASGISALVGNIDIASIGSSGSVSAESGGSAASGIYAGRAFGFGGNISMSSLDGQVTATAQNDWALGLAALGNIAITDQEACLAGDVTATATDGQASAGLVALGMINGGDDGEGGYNPMQVSGTVTATSGDGSAVGIMAWDAMNLRITGDISGTDLDSDASGNDEGYAIRSGRFNFLFDGVDFNGSTSAAEDMIEVADGGSLTGKVFLGDGNDAMRVVGEDVDPLNDAIISTVSVLDGGDGDGDLLTFDDWTGVLGNEVVNWETINLEGESVVNLGESKTAENLFAAPGDDYAAIKTFADGQFVTMTIGEDARLVAQGAVPGASAGEYVLEGNMNNNGVLDLLDDEVNDVFRIVSNDAGGGNYAAASELWIDADLSVSGVSSDEYVEIEGDAATKLEGYSGWFQVGSDLIAEGDKDTRFDLGLFAGVGYGEADVDGLRSDKAGELSQTAYGIGA